MTYTSSELAIVLIRSMAAMHALIAEGAAIARASRITSVLLALLASAIPVMTVGLAGVSVSSQRDILARVDDVGLRVVVARSTAAVASIPATAIDHLKGLAGVTWVVGLGPVMDLRANGSPSAFVPSREIILSGSPPISMTQVSDEAALISATSARRLQVRGAYGVLEPRGVPVMGWFRAEGSLADLERFVLISGKTVPRFERLIIGVDNAASVEPVAFVVPRLLGSDPTDITVEQSPALVEARRIVREGLDERDRAVVLAVLVGGTVMASAVVFAGTLGNQRDYGRRRALGATRPQLTLLIGLATLIPLCVGSLAGGLASGIWLISTIASSASWEFPTAIAILAVILPTAASVIPAAIAAGRDPVSILRVP